jgi:hypothetical protein
MRITIIKSDNRVSVDGESRAVDCSQLPDYLHAVQWHGDASPAWGEIEFAADPQGRKLPNLRFADFGGYEYLADAWRAAVPVGE